MRIDQHQRQNKPTSIIDDTVEHAHTYLVANRLQLVCQRNIIWLHRRPKIINETTTAGEINVREDGGER